MSDQNSDNMSSMSGDNMSGMGSGDLSNTTRKMIMHSSLYWGKDAIIVFPNWPNEDIGMYILAFFFVFLLAVASEVLSISPTVRGGTSPTKAGAVQAGVYAFHIGFTYLIMLSVMSFNVGIFLAAVAGHTLGFFLVKARTQALVNQPQADPKV
ncbi:Copper transporter 1 [Morus notabilis]|uniref:Copper transport protein n=1 Tax=Morus notabilis TaxID=981085 RepID=W9QSS4_9ROSA|nr:copper transporter 1 [Morus notabilis]EXB53359.1 Copper transporter 1 [Morus notabilis]